MRRSTYQWFVPALSFTSKPALFPVITGCSSAVLERPEESIPFSKHPLIHSILVRFPRRSTATIRELVLELYCSWTWHSGACGEFVLGRSDILTQIVVYNTCNTCSTGFRCATASDDITRKRTGEHIVNITGHQARTMRRRQDSGSAYTNMDREIHN